VRDPWLGLKVGVATYSFNRLPLDEAIKGLVRVGATFCSIKEAHMPLKSTAEERRTIAKQFRDAGINPLSCGNITLTEDHAQVRNAFEYARDAGIPTIVCHPTSKDLLPFLDKLVKEFDIKLAIHNHGPEDKVFPSPYDVWEAVQSFDPRVGLCVDVGHTARCQVDPAESIRKCAKRLHDVHIKDLVAIEVRSRPTEQGRGTLDTRAMLQALLDIKFQNLIGIEFERDLRDPIPGVAECMGYIKGMLSGMKAS
jgi:sugar phosphate isomerase/epimerase